jgi:uncharacterized protein YxjI
VLEGDLAGEDYTISSIGEVGAAVSQRLLVVRGTYTLDVTDAVHPGLALATLWAVDAFREEQR